MVNFLSFLLVLAIAWSTSYYAEKRGRNALLWFILGLFGIIPLIVLFILPEVPKRPRSVDPTIIEVTPVKEEPKIPREGWFYLDDENNQFGPISLTRLRDLLKNSTINQQSFVWNETMQDWAKLKEVIPQ